MKSFALVSTMLLAGVLAGAGCIKQSDAYGKLECVNGDSSKQCTGGSVCLEDNKCHQLCDDTYPCPSGTICSGRTCEPPAQPAPSITAVTGDGDANSTAGQADHLVHTGLVITGANMTNVTVSLAGQSSSLPTFASLTVRPSSTADRLEVDLPSSIVAGSYTLRVENQYGAAEVTTPFLKGDTGASGVCDASACVSQTFPGATKVSTVVARSVVTPGVSDVSVTLDGTELIAVAADGIWLGVLDRAKHALSTDTHRNRTSRCPPSCRTCCSSSGTSGPTSS